MNISAINNTIQQALGSPLYQKKFKNLKVSIDSREDFEALPFTTKLDLREFAPYQNLAVDLSQVLQCHTTSSTTGKPSVSFFTQQDLLDSKKYLAESWRNFGITQNSVVQFMMAYGLFGGAMMNTPAIQECGGFVVPAGIISSVQHWRLMQDFRVDTLVATPSFYLHFISFLQKEKIDLRTLNLKRGIVAGEPCSDKIKQLISSTLQIEVFNHYGLCEVNAGILYECKHCHHMVPIEDYVYVEVITPEGITPVVTGEEGELVVTSLKKEASPIVRYRTGDIVTKLGENYKDEHCQHRIVLSPVLSRTDTTIFYKGLKLDPYFIRDELISQFQEKIIPRIKIRVKEENTVPVALSILVAPISATIKPDEIVWFIKDLVGINAQVEFVDPEFFHSMSTTKDKFVETESQG